MASGPGNDPGGGEQCATVTQNCPKYLVFRITEGLLYYSGINCNSKLILECCVCFVAYRMRSNWYAIGVSGCVSVSHRFRENYVKNYKSYLAVISCVSSV